MRIRTNQISNVTIYDVAKRAGVSTATISRVLSRPEVVASATRDRVMRVVNQLGFAPNSNAKNLRKHATAKLLVTVPDLSNPFFSLILQGIEDAAQQNGYSVLVGDTQHDEKREERYALMLRRNEADGLIFLGHRLPEAAAELIQANRRHPAPIVNGCEFNPRLGVPSVHIDNEKAAYQAMDHLFALGHRRIGVVTGPLVSPLSRDRLAGVSARAKKEGASHDFVVMHGDFSIESGAVAAERLLSSSNRPTAIFCFNDEMAMGALKIARRLGLLVPEQLSLVGFDNIRFAEHLTPPLTTISQPMRRIGEGCVHLLLRILNKEEDATEIPASVTLPHQLIIRESTAPAPSKRRQR